jgi:hypothetical protein
MTKYYNTAVIQSVPARIVRRGMRRISVPVELEIFRTDSFGQSIASLPRNDDLFEHSGEACARGMRRISVPAELKYSNSNLPQSSQRKNSTKSTKKMRDSLCAFVKGFVFFVVKTFELRCQTFQMRELPLRMRELTLLMRVERLTERVETMTMRVEAVTMRVEAVTM